jgi:hypothetical protein
MGRLKGCKKHPNSIKISLPKQKAKITKSIRFERQHVEKLGMKIITRIARNAVEFHYSNIINLEKFGTL